MARPSFTNNIFSTTQRIKRTVTVFNTPHTVESNGIIYRPSTASDSFGQGITLSSASRAAMDSHFDSTGTPGVLNSSGNEEYGRIPLIYNYWGNGAPIGVRRPSAALLRFTGYVKTTGNYGLAVLGKGNVKVFHDDTSILYGSFDETNPKYLTSLRSFTAGDKIDVFYWGVDLNWSGICMRVFTDSSAIDSNGNIDWTVMREAPVLSASFMDDNQSVTSFELEETNSITTTTRAGQVRTLEIQIPQADNRSTFGWKWNNATKKLIQQQTSNEIRVGDLVKVSGGVFGDEHSLFTGNIIDIVPTGGIVQLRLASIEGRLAQQLSENFPDRLSYAAYGYTARSGTSDPVWSVPAYDHWPYEHALKDLFLRGWVDSSLLEGYKQLKRVGQSSLENGTKLFKVKGTDGSLIRLKRQANYGNPRGEISTKPLDDEYLYPSELTKTVYNRISDIIDTVGYDFGANEDGYIFVRPRNNADSVQQITGGTDTTNPAAIGGLYQTFTGTGWSVNISNVKASRIDLVVGRGPSLGNISVAVTRSEDSAVFNSTISTSNATEIFYHDRVYDVNFDNITSFGILAGEQYGTYDIQITPLGGSGSTEYRLDAIRLYDFDPEEPRTEYSLTNLENVLDIRGDSNYSERINDAIVTGKRKAAITDSSKAIERIETEFITSRATDINSILNPNADNYAGRKITAFLSNESIGSQDLSDWAAQNLVAHYRLPNADARVEHTILPTIEIRDPMKITDARFDYFDGTNVYYIVGYTHSITPTSAKTTIELSAFPETPSYEPKEDIDISLYNNKPVINLDISYPSLDGSSTISNPADGLAVQSDLVVDTGTLSSNTLAVTAGVISPGSDLLYVEPTEPLDSNEAVPFPDRGYYKNNPYHKFYTKTGSTLTLNFQMADGTSAYNPSGWGISATADARFSSHIIQDVYSGVPPFYDPYYSELSVPELVTITFDGLVSGYYRVSVVDARDPSDPQTIAWLTEPTVDSIDPEDHWEYRDSAADMKFYWDGVDNLGEWNNTQTEEYSWRQDGNFDTVESPLIGRGFYAANDQSTGMTHISDEVVSSQAVYPVGNYAQFFIRVEVLRDTDNTPLKVESNVAEDVLDSSASQLTDRYIYYHLPAPNRATISISDWDISAGSFNPSAPGNSWGGPDSNATIRDAKPVRVTITPVQRKGAKFSADEAYASLKISRSVHLTSNIYDLSAVFFGRKWNDRSLSTEEKRIVARRHTVDDHSLVTTDDSFNSPTGSVEWIFYPSLFRLDFGQGEEAINYLDYLQLAEIPSWNPKRLPGEERSRSLLNLMNYLFYFSVYTQDRSGRLVWSVDTSFVDKSKILTNSTATTFPDNLERHQRRTIYVRQWWDHDLLAAEHGSSGWNVPSNLRGGFADVWDFHNSGFMSLYPDSTGSLVVGSTITSFSDDYTDDLVTRNRHEMLSGGNTARDLGSLVSPLGNWTWENDGVAWVANISRDFHPFYIVPPMALAGYEGDYGGGRGPWWRQNYFYGIVDYRGNDNTGDEARFDSWFAILKDYTQSVSGDVFIMAPGRTMKEYYDNSLVTQGRVTIEDPSKYLPVLNYMIAYQRQDDIKHYEMIRGGYSNGAGKSRDLLNVLGGDPYYQNVKLYRYFRMGVDLKNNMTTKWYNDVDRKGWFHVTFRHTYNWESSSLFPVDVDKFLVPGAIDSDITGSPLTAYSYDPGAYTGWKDDHPSSSQGGTWIETGTCSALHWRNDYTNHGEWWSAINAEAGGTCSIENPTVALSQEVLPRDYDINKNIFMQRYVSSRWKQIGGTVIFDRKSFMPVAVGPRLPQTRRALFNLVLLNNRRGTSI